MKKTFTTLATLLVAGAGFTLQAQDFQVPEAMFTVPLHGEAELLYNMFQVTWGYYPLVDNAGDDPITATLIKPDGTELTVKGNIDDANMEGTQEGLAPSTEQNALSFRNFMKLDEETMQLIQEYGTYKVNIPEGVVLVNGVPNPEANLEFKVLGEEKVSYLPTAQMVYPSSSYLSYASLIQVNWPDQEIFFTEGVESMDLFANLDGEKVGCTATVREVEGGNEDGTGAFTMSVLSISFDDFLSYEQGMYLTVEIPEGIVGNTEGAINRAQSFELILLPQISGTLSPENNATLISDEAFVTVSWEGLSVQPIGDDTTVIARDSTGADTPVEVEFGNDASITVDLTSLPAGTYELIIPEAFALILTEEGLIIDYYALNSEIYATYTIKSDDSSGIENINAGNDVYNVVTLDGKIVLSNGDLNALNKLAKGIYIVNGVKRVLK